MQKLKKTKKKKCAGKTATHTAKERARRKTAHTLMRATTEMERIKLIFLLYCHLLHLLLLLLSPTRSRLSSKENEKVAPEKRGGSKWVVAKG